MIYYLDSNILIEAKNRYYGMDFVPGFWDFIDQKMGTGPIYSISQIYDELSEGQDELAQWIIARKDSGFFQNANDRPIQQTVSVITTHLMSGNYNHQERAKFLNRADPWLIAKAKQTGATIVTHEKLLDSNSTKVRIPNICQLLEVPYIDTFSLLRQLNASFK